MAPSAASAAAKSILKEGAAILRLVPRRVPETVRPLKAAAGWEVQSGFMALQGRLS